MDMKKMSLAWCESTKERKGKEGSGVKNGREKKKV
jgi:hypothetical protein